MAKNKTKLFLDTICKYDIRDLFVLLIVCSHVFTDDDIKMETYEGVKNLFSKIISFYNFSSKGDRIDFHDENSKDKYELTRYIMTNSEAYRNIVFRNIGMIKNVCLGILQVEKDIEENYNYSITVDRAREVMKDASRIGSVMLIDTLSKEEIYDILLGKILKRVDVEAVSND